MCNNVANQCLQSSYSYVCDCLFDEMVKIKFSRIRCHEEIIMLLTNYALHLYSLSLTFFCERAILCQSCAGVFMIMASGERICSHFEAKFNDNRKIKVSCCVKCLRAAICRYRYILPHIML